jgi:hypothetical protein
MTDAVAIFDPGWRALDEFGAIVAGGQLRFYAAGTSDSLEVFSDKDLSQSLGAVVDLNSGGHPITSGQHRTLVYVGAVSYRVQLRDASAVTVWDHDDVQGALNTSPFGATLATPRYVMQATGNDVTITADQVGSLWQVDSSGGDRQVTLPNAVDVAVGVPIGIKHAGAGNTVTYSAVASQTISIPGVSPEPESVTLTGNGATHWIVSDGANWKLIDEVRPAAADQIIGDVTVSVAVANVEFTIPAGVTGFRVLGTGLSCSTTGNLNVSISDDAGSSFETITGRFMRDNANTVSGADLATSTPSVVVASVAASTDVNFELEVKLADLAAAKKPVVGHGSSANDNQAVWFQAESASCDAINLVRIAFSTGNIDAGRIICQRL